MIIADADPMERKSPKIPSITSSRRVETQALATSPDTDVILTPQMAEAPFTKRAIPTTAPAAHAASISQSLNANPLDFARPFPKKRL